MALIVQKFRLVFGMVLVLALAACATPEVAQGVSDPYEVENRQRHDMNRDLDRFILRPGSNAYGTALPEPVRQGVNNFASNLSMPSVVMNDLLQGRIDDAAHNSIRFLLNSTIGLAGLLDLGTKNGLELRDSDFGETLYVWGLREGPYLELPVVGPSTTRHAFGRVVDLFTNPVSYMVARPEAYIPPAAKLGSALGNRYRYGDTIDSVLYESADSYTQARLFYLENRRFRLGSSKAEDDVYDIYEDLYD